MAEDHGTPSLSSTVSVTIIILDLDAQPPRFEKSLYETIIKEDVAINVCFLQVNLIILQ